MNDTNPKACHHDDDPDALRRQLLTLLPALGLGGAAHAQDASKVQPGAYRVVLENAQLRVLEYRSRPGLGVCGVGMHSHPAHLTIALSPAKVRIKLPDGKTIIGENALGDVFWSEAETHETENVGGKDARALVVELKSPGTTAKKA
jgi:beta-alanine degradation protein BauB